MVRETRHLWVGNLPDNIREDRIREHFKRYGRVQNVKLLGRTETGGGLPAGASGVCATVAFMDIKSASKAHNVEHVLDERTLTTEYYEPAAIPAGGASAGSSPAGSGYSSSSVNSAPAPAPPAAAATATAAAPPATAATRYHPSGEEVSPTCALAAAAAAPANWRGTNDSASDYCGRRGSTPAAYGRYARTSTAPYATPPSNADRSTPHHRWYGSGERGATGAGTGGESTPSTPGGGTDGGRRRQRSGSGSSRSRSRSRSRSDSSSPEPSDHSRASSPAAAAHHAHSHSHAAQRTPPAHHHQWASTANGRPLAICVRNLPTRSTDSSLKDGLYHEYKKHGKVVWVKVVGQNADRYAVVRFKKPSDVEKALEVSQDKSFFGNKISVAPHQSCDEDADSAKPYETDIDEYHPKATRTLFIGNLEKDVTQQQLRDKFKHFGRIIEIDIKKGSGGGAGYAFCQYAAISSVVEAIRSMDGEYVGGSRVKLGFGKPVATTCVWVDGLTESTEKQVLACVARCGAATSVCVDRAAGAALVHFEQAGAAGQAVRELRRVAAHASAAEPERPRLAVDYASRECQEAFYDQLEKHGGAAALAPPERLPLPPDPAAAAPAAATASRYPSASASQHPIARHDTPRYESCGSRSRASSYGRSSSRTPRYSALEHYDPTDYAADRRYRVYDELGNTSQLDEIALYEDRLQSVVVSSPHRSRRHRRDSSPEDRKHSKERHRSVTLSGVRRSRSGSCGGAERHSGRRRHRRRCEGSGSRGSRAGTPLRDEPDGAPSEPRRGPRACPPRPMLLPLPRFGLSLLRPAAPGAASPRSSATAAPASPPRPRSASSSSAGSAPHSPSIEERIRSLDEKLSGSRGAPDPPDRARFRNRLFELDINEVKPSEVVRSLLAKRSVFDEDSERLEGARAPSPGAAGSPRARPAPAAPRALRYPFPVHPPPAASAILSTAASAAAAPAAHAAHPLLADGDHTERPADPRLNRPDRPYVLERLGKFNESDYKSDSKVRLRTPSIDKLQSDLPDRWQTSRPDGLNHEQDKKKNTELVRRNSLNSVREDQCKERRLSIESDTFPKRADSIHGVQDEQVKKERQLSIEVDCELKKRDCVHSIGDTQIKVERSLSTESESENKRHNTVTIFREAQIKIERLLSFEKNPKPNMSNEEKKTFVELSSGNKTQDSVNVDRAIQNNDERQLPETVSEPKITDSIHVSPETVVKDEKQLSMEAEEREIKEAIEKIDPDNKDIQSLIHDDKINQQNIKADSSQSDKPNCHNEPVDSVDRPKKQQNTSVSTTLLSSPRILEHHSEKRPIPNDISVKSAVSPDLLKCDGVVKSSSAELDQKIFSPESELCKDILIQNHINKELLEFEMQHGHLNSLNSIKPPKNVSEIGQELLKNSDKNGKERYSQNMIIEAFHTHLEKENIQFDKHLSKDQSQGNPFPNDKKISDIGKNTEDRRDKAKHSKDRIEKDRHDVDKDKVKGLRNEKVISETKIKEDAGTEKLQTEKKSDKEHEKHKEKSDKEKIRHIDDKKSRHDHHRKDRSEREDDKKREKRKDDEGDITKAKKDEKHKHERSKKENIDSKRDSKKEDSKSRKSSRDETARDLYRKDSTDSSTSRASHESSKPKEIDHPEIKEEPKTKLKGFNGLFTKIELEKELTSKVVGEKLEAPMKIKTETKEEKDITVKHSKHKVEQTIDNPIKFKSEVTEKPRHYSLDSPSVECKRKERLNSCSSLPSNLGQKRRISSHDSPDSVMEDVKKNKQAIKTPERRDSKDCRSSERPKTTKFNKGYFAKIIESKTKDDKKNQVKPPDESSDPGQDHDKIVTNDPQPDGLQNHLDFLATLELRSSEEDEKQKALMNEMKEKKRIQQLQQIQELQMQQDALQHAELIAKLKDEKKKCEDKKKEAARDKRMSTERKSREDKSDSGKRKNRKQLSTDSSDSDEPKKNHSIFDVVDDEPAYISMYDKVKARSCKNMQKQEEEKRQEKIKAKFSQLKQSRAKREEKKRYSWDEDSDSDHERRKPHKSSVDSSTDDDHFSNDKKREKLPGPAFDFDRIKINDYFSTPSNEEDSRNKLSRKNSRSRIISDTSDDDVSKRSFSKSPSFNDIRKEFMTDYESMQRIRDELPTKESIDKIKKNSLLNLFGRSDSEDSKIKSGFDSSDKSLTKTMSNDFSSEGENVTCNRISNEIRKKHKKKLKKHKFSFSDDDSKIGKNALISGDISKLENRRHGTKKEKRREAGDSIDGDHNKYEKTKIKKEKKLSSFDLIESNFNNKKDGKMEDIFGPLSDDSDRDLPQNNNVDFSRHDFDSAFGLPNSQVNATSNIEEKRNKDGGKVKKEKRRKEKRLVFMKDDENSLDVDAVSKAIEARLFADNEDDEQEHKTGSLIQTHSKSVHNNFEYPDKQYTDTAKLDRHMEKVKRDCKKKKKKKNREDRQNRREHHHHLNHHHEKKLDTISNKSLLLDIPLPTDANKAESVENQTEKKLASESPSLPRLTDSPPIAPILTESDIKNRDSDATDCSGGDHNMDVEYVGEKTIEVNDIPMPPPLENIVKDISKVPLPLDPEPEKEDQKKVDAFLPNFCRDIDISEDAVRSITNFEKECTKPIEKIDNLSPKADKKLDEKQRAVISQEETEDAVAALLGESFGEKDDTFANHEEVDNDVSHQTEIECSATVNENIPEEDAEEMRQAVQNLNACEMEMKPDTPVSDNDLLLIDTDTEEADDLAQDNVGRLPVNVITTNHELSRLSEEKSVGTTEIPTLTQKSPQLQNMESKDASPKMNEPDIKIHLPKRDLVSSSTATPVITSLTLTNNKTLEPHVMNIKATPLLGRENDVKPTHITANIVQLRAPQNQTGPSLRPIIAPNRGNATPYQVVNHVIRPQSALNMQPPTIKIPDPHILYQRPQGIVISPRMTKDLLSPKGSPQGESMPSPRLSNVAYLSTSPQNLTSMGLTTPTSIQQRSPGQVTVVRMQQPPLSPIQAIHLPPGARTMVSPNRPNSVLVQTHGAPIHLNRLPVTPVLAPISKQVPTSNILQQNKVTGSGNSSLFHQQKITIGDNRRTDNRLCTENVNDHSKIILSSTSLKHSTNPTVMAQNRLISMQNAVQTGNINLNNKILTNNVSHINEKIDTLLPKSDLQNHVSYSTAPIIRIAGANHSNASIIQSGSKPIMSTIQDPSTRGQGSNVIHTLNSQRLLTTVPMSNVIQIDAKNAPSVLSMAAIRPPTVLAKPELPISVAVTSNSQNNIVMAPLLLKTSTAHSPLRSPNMKNEGVTVTQFQHSDEKKKDSGNAPSVIFDRYSSEILKDSKSTKITALSQESITKCETDFEELLKDKTNEIKITNHPDKKLEVNVGKTVTMFPANAHFNERVLSSKDISKKEIEDRSDSKIDTNGNAKPVAPENKSIETNPEPNIKTEFPDLKNDFNVQEKTSLQSSLDVLSSGSTKIELNDSGTNFCAVLQQSNCSSSQTKCLDDNDSWSAKDVNIESVIKKVDSLCNETDADRTDANEIVTKEASDIKPSTDDVTMKDVLKPMDMETEPDAGNIEEITDRNAVTSKRGGRSIRGRKAEKNQDRVQTRQISKPSRGGASAKRGRGRAKVDKKIQNLINNSINNLPGDVYDFHDDSGDETSASLNKNETRPRLILTIKSPATANTNATATNIAVKEVPSPKDQTKIQDGKCEKDDRLEDYMSPSANTRKSRRLQEKDVHRTTVDDVIDDVVKSSIKSPAKDNNKKRATRQTGVKASQVDKSSATDTRKSPRGMKRTRDRSLSDVSLDSNSCPADSNEEKNSKKDDLPKPVEPKIPKLGEPLVTPKSEPDPPQPAKTVANATANIPPVVTTSAPTPTPIMKPPKKMISEISAKLASAFEAAAAAGPARQAAPAAEAEKLTPLPRDIRNPEFAMAAPAASELMTAATGDARVGPEMALASVGEAALARRLDAAGAAEAGDARVQSPALPHRPPDALAHRATDRPTPLLIRGGDGSGAHLGVGLGAGVGAGAGLGGMGGALGGMGGPPPCAGPSLPRGAHHPPLPQPARPQHHHHPGAASRVNITSIPSISPQSQIGLSAELVRSPPPAHQQTSPVSVYHNGEGMYPHFSHQHYQMYQQHFRATQHENRATPPYTRALEAEGCEAPAPPLELRRPPSARVPRPAHSPSPADRLIMYGSGCGRSPPPAHLHAPPPPHAHGHGHALTLGPGPHTLGPGPHTLGPGPHTLGPGPHTLGPGPHTLGPAPAGPRLPGALPATLPPGPPHAAHAPREADSLHSLLQRYPVMWQGLLALKNDSAAVQMHFVGGNMAVAGDTLPRHTDGSTPPLRIAQRMRLEPQQLDQVHRKMKLENEHCMLLALPCGRDHMDVLQQSTNLTAGFITYLQRKQAAGIVNVAPPGHQQAMYTVHIFPSCDFANENLNRIAPDLMHRVADIAHLLIVIATV